jgi:uncharacterized protein (DUF1330 family)
MKTHCTVGLSVLAGIGLGAVAVQGIHAQAKPPTYVIAEIDVTNQDGYAKEYIPLGQKAVLDGGAKYLARGTKTTSFKGEPPKRIVLLVFDDFDKAQATFTSPAFMEAARIGDRHAKFRIFAVEGLPQ